MMSICGIENELALGTSGQHASAAKKNLVLGTLMGVKSIATAVPSCDPGSPPGSPAGFMLGTNGGRIYMDGEYIECATPEVRTPLEAVTYQRAMELVVLESLSRTLRPLKLDPGTVKFIRSSIDYAEPETHFRGMHVNVLTRMHNTSALVEHLVPFLVTRFYSCAGSLSSSGFVMSQKNRAIKTVASVDTRGNRGIVDLRNESLAGSGYKRVHITMGDATMAELSTYLSVGCTVLVVEMLEDGVCVGPAYALLDPVAVLQRLDTDLSWSGPLALASGLEASALDIQEHYLKAAEIYTKRRGEQWMLDVVDRWRKSVDAIRAGGPGALSKMLDPYIKLKLYSEHLKRKGLTIEEFSHWCYAVDVTKAYLNDGAGIDIHGFLRERMPRIRFHFLEDRMKRFELDWGQLPKAAELYNEMIAMDIVYHDIGENGLYHRLAKAQAVNSRMTTEEEILDARCQPPKGTRAEARAKAICEIASDSGAVANWWEAKSSRRRTRFMDPFQTEYSWEPQQATGNKK